jgi:non-specific serine/threonine protein kinase
MYAVGGRVEGIGRAGSLADVDAYDFATGRWSGRAPMSEGKDHHATAVHDGMIYALGGRKGRTEAFATFERYDPERDRWERLPDYPLPVSGAGLVSVDGRLIAAGGEDPGRGLLIGRAYEYDVEGGRWKRLPAMARPKHGFGDLAANGRFWAFGGAECYGFEPARSVDSLNVRALG